MEGALVGEDWRSEERYADVHGCSAAALAWEFLRRNPDFSDEFAHLGQDASSGQGDADGAGLALWLDWLRAEAAALRTQRQHHEGRQHDHGSALAG